MESTWCKEGERERKREKFIDIKKCLKVGKHNALSRDPGHDHMFLNVDACSTELKACKNARIGSSGVAATRGAGSLAGRGESRCLETIRARARPGQ